MNYILARFLPAAVTSTSVYIVLSALALHALLHQLFFRPLFFSPLRKAPGPPFGHILYGQFRNILQAEAGVLQREWAEKYGAIVRAVGPLGIERMMFLSPSALEHILVSHWKDYPRPDFLRDVLGIVAGFGLFTVTGSEHKRMLRAVNPAFSITNLTAQTDMYYPPIEGLVKILHDRTSSPKISSAGAIVAMYDWVSRVTLDIICETAFGYRADSVHNPNNKLACAYHQLISLQSGTNMARFFAVMTIPRFSKFLRTNFAYRNRTWLFPRWSPISPLQPLLSAMHAIKAAAGDILAEKLAEADEHDGQSKRDIMSLLVRARTNEKGEGYQMSDQDLVEQVLTFLSAGHETTAAGVSWTLWLLANDSEAQSRLRAEVTPLLVQDARPGYHTLKECTWLDCVVMESLRVLPPVPMTIRKAGKAGWVEGYHLPKDTLLYIPIRVVNTWSQIWGPDATEFNPARWLDLPSTYNPNLSLLSFIAGPHACTGRTMAIMKMKAILAVLIAHFSFAPAYEGQVAKPTAAFTMTPADDLPLRVTPVGSLPIPA